jgi:hypothetical protein
MVAKRNDADDKETSKRRHGQVIGRSGSWGVIAPTCRPIELSHPLRSHRATVLRSVGSYHGWTVTGKHHEADAPTDPMGCKEEHRHCLTDPDNSTLPACAPISTTLLVNLLTSPVYSALANEPLTDIHPVWHAPFMPRPPIPSK